MGEQKRSYRPRSNPTSRRVLRTQAWRELRERWAARLPQPCPRCDRDVMPWEPWDLDHVGAPLALGGEHNPDIRPAHRSCNRRAGAELRQQIYAAGSKALAENNEGVFLSPAALAG